MSQACTHLILFLSILGSLGFGTLVGQQVSALELSILMLGCGMVLPGLVFDLRTGAAPPLEFKIGRGFGYLMVVVALGMMLVIHYPEESVVLQALLTIPAAAIAVMRGIRDLKV